MSTLKRIIEEGKKIPVFLKQRFEYFVLDVKGCDYQR